jgi:transcriptional regulator with XRE-family HTH domain
MTNAADDPGSFSALLRQRRKAAGLSQEELADAAGLSRRGISDLERGVRRRPYPATLRRLISALGLSSAERAELLLAAAADGRLADEHDRRAGGLASAERPAHTAAGRPPLPTLTAAVVLAMAFGIAATLLMPGAVELSAAAGTPEAATQASPPDMSPPASTELALAGALVDALNHGDEDAVVALFDPEATLHMERYAWLQFEIRQWARAQIADRIVIEPEGPIQAVPNHALWTARVQRDDWRERGVESVRLANHISTDGERILDFSADPLDGTSVIPLGALWRPGSPPDPMPPLTQRRLVDDARAREAPAPPLALPLSAVLSPLIIRAACRRRSRGLAWTASHALVVRLGSWQRRRGKGSG